MNEPELRSNPPRDEQTRAVLAVLLQHARDLNSTGDVVRELRQRVLGQAKVEIVRDRAFDQICETLFDSAFDLGRAYQSWLAAQATEGSK